MKRISPQDIDRLFAYYESPEYAEFFRRVPRGLSRAEFSNIEQLTGASFFVDTFGFACLADIDTYGGSCQIGFLLDKEYWDQKINEKKIAFLMTYNFVENLFKNTQIRKVSMRFLSNRTDIKNSLVSGKFKKEAEFKQSVYFDGKYQDELEYALLKEEFERFY